jgi:hypothetical protein
MVADDVKPARSTLLVTADEGFDVDVVAAASTASKEFP